MHQQQWLAVLEELGPELATNAPGENESAPEHQRDAYGFFNHLGNGVDIPWGASPARCRRRSHRAEPPRQAPGGTSRRPVHV
jgi:hypothetical protein